MGDIDTAGLKANFALVAGHGPDEVAQYFYSYLFLRYPQTRDMFPPAMTKQRDRLVGALVRIVTNVDQVDQLVPYLQDLGRDHRKFGTLTAHYPAVGEALLTTLRHFSGPAWTETLEADWTAAYGIVAGTMSGAAEQIAATEPAYWAGEIIEVDQRTFDIAVLTVRTDEPVPYLAGQSLALEPTTTRPREWRWYTPANAPGGLDIELHARLIAGGPVSTALVRSSTPGDQVRLGPPVGQMTLDPDSKRPVLMIAGSTGLAPMKAMIGQIARSGGRTTQLYFGARSQREIYDGKALAALQEWHGWLTVTTAISDDIQWLGRHGLVGEVAAGDADWSGHDVYVCGSPAMVQDTVNRLLKSGVPGGQIRFEDSVRQRSGSSRQQESSMTRTPTDADETFTGATLVTTTFPTTRGLSRAGYDTHEVDAFLVRSAAAVDGLISRLNAAERQLADSQTEIARLRDRIDRDSRSDEVQQAVSILTSAQITADATVTQADEYSARVMTEAQQLYEETRRNAAILEQETQDKAKAVYEDALLRVEAYERENEGRLAQLTVDTAVAQQEVDQQTAYLRTLRDAARVQLQVFLEGLLDHLAEEYGRANPVAANAANGIVGAMKASPDTVDRRAARRQPARTMTRAPTGTTRASAPIPIRRRRQPSR